MNVVQHDTNGVRIYGEEGVINPLKKILDKNGVPYRTLDKAGRELDMSDKQYKLAIKAIMHDLSEKAQKSIDGGIYVEANTELYRVALKELGINFTEWKNGEGRNVFGIEKPKTVEGLRLLQDHQLFTQDYTKGSDPAVNLGMSTFAVKGNNGTVSLTGNPLVLSLVEQRLKEGGITYETLTSTRSHFQVQLTVSSKDVEKLIHVMAKEPSAMEGKLQMGSEMPKLGTALRQFVQSPSDAEKPVLKQQPRQQALRPGA